MVFVAVCAFQYCSVQTPELMGAVTCLDALPCFVLEVDAGIKEPVLLPESS